MLYKWASQVVKNLPVNAGDVRDTSSIPGWGRVLGEENGNPLQCSCLENYMDRGAWWATVHRVAKSRTWPLVERYLEPGGLLPTMHGRVTAPSC